MKLLGLRVGLEDKTAIVQGLGNVGYHAALYLQEAGVRIVAVAEYDGAVVDAKGLDIESLGQHRRDTGSVLDFPGSENLLPSAKALELECDILVPAALENQITVENAGRIRAKIVAEAANAPTTPEAGDALLARGVWIIPDTYLNAGGVTVSYFEWLKNISHVRFGRMEKRFDELSNRRLLDVVSEATGTRIAPGERGIVAGPDEEDLVNSGLEETMIHAYEEIRVVRDRIGGVGLRSAALVAAIDKIVVSYESLGIFP